MIYTCNLCKDKREFGDRRNIRLHIKEVHGIKGPSFTQLRERMPSEITHAMLSVEK